MGRRVTGSIEWRGVSWWARVTMPDKSRPWIEMPGIPHADEVQARELAAVMAKRAKANGVVPVYREETVTEYLTRWAAWRTERGLSSAEMYRKILAKHFASRHGHMPMAAVSKPMLEDFVTSLDRASRRGEMSWKSACNIWGGVASMFRDAAGAKDRNYRVIDTNPALGVLRPDTGVKRVKTYLYPNELLQLLTCERVPLVRRRLYAATTYLKLRAGEVEALDWTDIDLDHGTALIHQAIDRSKSGSQTKATKSDKSRRVRMEKELVPMLEAMKGESGKGRVFPVMPTRNGNSGYAYRLRLDLTWAGVTRAELHEATKTRKSMTFHDLRATGLTWMAVRGDDAFRIRESAGHSDFATTQMYVREADVLKAGFGEVFPPLPACLLGSVQIASAIVSQLTKHINSSTEKRPRQESELPSKDDETTAKDGEPERVDDPNRPLAVSSPLSAGSWSDLPAFARESGDDFLSGGRGSR